MSVTQRIKRILLGLMMLLAAIAFLVLPEDGTYSIIIALLALGLAIRGIKDIAFYFTMARHMVGGKMILFQGVVVLDFALFTGSLHDVPKIYILLYLVGIHAFSGAIEILRALEAKRTVGGPWKMKMGHGLINLGLALTCLIFLHSTSTAVIIYSIGLLYSAIVRIISGFRRTAFVVIE